LPGKSAGRPQRDARAASVDALAAGRSTRERQSARSREMKLLSFFADGKEFFGAANGDGVVTLNKRIGQPNLRAALAAGKMEAMRRAATEAKPDRKLADVKFRPVIPRPEKILCAGINYRSHAAETGRELPMQPSMFVRFADTLVGHDGDMIRPTVSDNF